MKVLDKSKNSTVPKKSVSKAISNRSKESTRQKKKVQKGGDDGHPLALPISKLWVPMISLKTHIFQKRLVSVSQDIANIVIKDCVLNCKQVRDAKSFDEFKALMSVITSLDNINPEILDNDIFIRMFEHFLQAVFFPIAKLTSDLMESKLVTSFVELMNTKTRTNYVANFCVSRNSQEIDGKKVSGLYTCGRAISTIPYDEYATNQARILIHRTVDALNDEQDYDDVLIYLNDIKYKKNSMT